MEKWEERCGLMGLKILKQVGFLKLPRAINHPTHRVMESPESETFHGKKTTS